MEKKKRDMLENMAWGVNSPATFLGPPVQPLINASILWADM